MKYLILFCTFLGAAAVTVAQAATDRIVLPSTVTPTQYALDVTVDPTGTGFGGTEKVDLNVKSPTQQIVLNAVNLKIKGFTVTPGGVRGAARDVVFDEQRETATLKLPTPLAPGAYTLAIDYTGRINDSFAGLFKT